MVRIRSGFLSGRRERPGFTLLELLIVGSLIALFAGLAIVAFVEMYNSNRHKIMWDEGRTIGTTLSTAYLDVGFFPRIYLLDMPLSLLGPNPAAAAVMPGFDTYGFYSATSAPLSNIRNNWRGPYTRVVAARANLTAGTRGIAKMRLTDAEYQSLPSVGGQDLSLVTWPTDTWGNPYVVYQISSDQRLITASNPKGLRLISRPSEEGDYLNAVVSYGRNRVPGGPADQNLSHITSIRDQNVVNGLRLNGLYIVGDVKGGGADFSLRSLTSSYPETKIDATFMTELIKSLENYPGAPAGFIGVNDVGSDDVCSTF